MSYGAARYMRALVRKHGDDTQAMFRDIELNNEQLSVGQLKKLLRTFHAIYGDDLDRVPEHRIKSLKQLRLEAEAERERKQQREAQRLLSKQAPTSKEAAADSRRSKAATSDKKQSAKTSEKAARKALAAATSSVSAAAASTAQAATSSAQPKSKSPAKRAGGDSKPKTKKSPNARERRAQARASARSGK